MDMQLVAAPDPGRIWMRSVGRWAVIGAVAWAVTFLGLGAWIPPHGDDWLIDVLAGALLGLGAGPISGLSGGWHSRRCASRSPGAGRQYDAPRRPGQQRHLSAWLVLSALPGWPSSGRCCGAVLLTLVTAGLGYLTGPRVFYGRRPRYAPAQPDVSPG